jgi:hypothetical protein
MATLCAAETQPRTARRLDPSIPLFLAALVPGLYHWFHPVGFGFGHGFEMVAVAKNLVAQGTFGNPFEPAITGPTAAEPPLYPVFLALLIKIFHEPLCGAAALLVNILLNAAIAALLPRVSKAFYRDALPGVFAGALWIFVMRLMPQWDTSLTTAGLLAFCWISSVRRGAIFPGFLAGMLSLLNPVTVLVIGAWTGLLAITRKSIRYPAAIAAIVFLCNTPWLARNYRIWHSLVVRTNFGMTLYSSNNDCAQASLVQNGRNGCFQKTHAVASDAEAALLRRLGEVEYDHQRAVSAMAWIHSHRERFWQLTLARIAQFWFPEPDQSPFTVYGTWAITLLSLPGLVRMKRHRESALWFMLAVMLLYPLTYYVVAACDRYRYPILWLSLLPAGYWLASWRPAREYAAAAHLR